MRRAVVRAAVSASRVPSTKTSMLCVASQFAAPTVTRFSAPIAVRCFSQTFRAAAEDGFSSLESASEGEGQSRQDSKQKYASSRVSTHTLLPIVKRDMVLTAL